MQVQPRHVDVAPARPSLRGAAHSVGDDEPAAGAACVAAPALRPTTRQAPPQASGALDEVYGRPVTAVRPLRPRGKRPGGVLVVPATVELLNKLADDEVTLHRISRDFGRCRPVREIEEQQQRTRVVVSRYAGERADLAPLGRLGATLA